ncbi:MAG: nicotinate (nicotinamide) nucleotide adenylyltransferase [Akkermansiaceae bacterium]
MTERQKIAFFGGTFDPIHEGHLEIAQKAVTQIGLKRVIFIPCRQSPHKTEAPSAADADRLKMLELATADLSWAEVSDFELKKPPPSFTWETVRHFRETLAKSARLFLIIGFDQWKSLPRWKNIETLALDIEFIVVGRTEQPHLQEGYRAHFINGNHPASASEIRKKLSEGREDRWLHHDVAKHILEKDLYSPLR